MKKQPAKTTTKPIDRSWDGVTDVLFDELENLRAGKTRPDHANSISRLAGEITRSKLAQLEFARFVIAHKRAPGSQIALWGRRA